MGSALALVDQAIVSLTNFITIVVLAKLCATNIFGSFALAWQIVSYVRSTNERLISAPYLVFVQRPLQDRRSLLGSSLGHEFTFGILSSLLLVLVGVALKVFGLLPQFSTGIIVVAIAVPWVVWRDHLRAISFANFRAEFAVMLDLAAAVLQLSGIAALAHFDVLNLLNIGLVLAFASLIPVVVWFCAKPFSMNVERDRFLRDWLESWEYARWLVYARCLGIGAYLVVPWIIASKLGDAPTGAFAICLSLAGLSLMFVTGLNNFLQPLAVRSYREGGKSGLVKTMWASVAVFTVVLLPLCVVYYFFGGQLLATIYKNSFREHASVIFILGLNVLAFSYAIVASNGLAALERPEGNFWGEISNFVVSCGLGFLLIGPFGLPGAALAITIGSVVATFVTLFAFVRIMLSTEIPIPTEASAT